MNGDVYVWIFIIAVIVLLFLIVGYILLRTPNSLIGELEIGATFPEDGNPSGTGPFAEPFTPVDFLYTCTVDSDCSEGLACDPFYRECRVPIGSPCNIRSDCVTGLYCSGVCLDPVLDPPSLLTKILADPCPCPNSNYTCTNDTVFSDGVKKVCLFRDGMTCTTGNQCASGVCDITSTPSTCISGYTNGEVCSNDGQCLSRNCSLGVCQNLGTVTGTAGASCNNEASCNTGLVCSVDGTCTVPSTGLLLPCDPLGNTCPAVQNCYFAPSQGIDGNYPPPESSNGFELCNANSSGQCICLYDTDTNTAIPTPNAPSLNDFCISGYTAFGNSCLAPVGQPCNNALSCTFGSCNGPPRLFRFVPSTSEFGRYPETGVYGATSVSYEPVGENSPGNILSITGYTLGTGGPTEGTVGTEGTVEPTGTDVLYVRTSQGVFTLIDKNWVQILSSVRTDSLGNTLNLIDISAVALTESVGVLLVGYRVIDRTGALVGDAIFSYAPLTGELFPYNETVGSVDYPGIQYTTSGIPISFDTFSITAGPVGTDLNVLLVSYSPNVSVYFKLYSTDMYTSKTSLLTGTTISRIYLGYGITLLNGELVSYPLITYVSSLNQSVYRRQRFTESLDPNVVSDSYTDIMYPSGLYGAPVEFSLVYSYTYSNYDPVVDGFSNGSMVASIGTGSTHLYYISEGNMTALPIYVSGNTLLYMTLKNVYVFSSSTCS